MLRKAAPGALIALSLMPVPAFAHVAVGPADTLSQGFMHPMSGIDHILAMVAVGIYAASLGGRALWLVPSAFISTMIVGGLLGYTYTGWSLPLVEHGIGLSVVMMGLAIAFGIRLPTIAAMALVGLFALFHGHAHGSEGAGLGTTFLPYAAGFILATGLLHVTGIVLSRGLDHLGQRPADILNRSMGAVGICAGISFLAGWLVA